jgi:hypothetical protein
MNEVYYSTDQVSALLGVAVSTLHVWSSCGGGPHRMKPVRSPGRPLQWPRTDVLRAMAERGVLVLQGVGDDK